MSRADEFPPVTTFHELLKLDYELIAAGYNWGMAGEPAPPAAMVGRSFMHGWFNGAAAAGTLEMTPEQLALRADYGMRVHEEASTCYH